MLPQHSAALFDYFFVVLSEVLKIKSLFIPHLIITTSSVFPCYFLKNMITPYHYIFIKNREKPNQVIYLIRLLLLRNYFILIVGVQGIRRGLLQVGIVSQVGIVLSFNTTFMPACKSLALPPATISMSAKFITFFFILITPSTFMLLLIYLSVLYIHHQQKCVVCLKKFCRIFFS